MKKINELSVLAIEKLLTEQNYNNESNSDMTGKMKIDSALRTLNNILLNMNYSGDTLHYLNRLSKTNSSLQKSLQQNGLYSITDFLNDKKSFLKSSSHKVSSLDELEIGSEYNSYRIMSYSHNYHTQFGITIAYDGQETKPQKRTIMGLILKGDFSNAQTYPNSHDEDLEKIEYHLMNSSNGLPNFDTKTHLLILNNSFPIHFFKTIESNQKPKMFRYLGTYECLGKSELYPKTHVTLVKSV